MKIYFDTYVEQRKFKEFLLNSGFFREAAFEDGIDGDFYCGRKWKGDHQWVYAKLFKHKLPDLIFYIEMNEYFWPLEK